MLRRLLIAIALAAALTGAACRWLLPERFAVNAPIAHLLFGRGIEAPPAEQVSQRFRAAPGFGVSLYASELPGARMLRATRGGHLLVSLSRAGRVVLLEPDADGDGAPDGRRTLLEDLDGPHGLDIHGGWLYVAEGSAVARIRFDPETGTSEGALERIVEGLPAGGNHWTRNARIGPDGALYVSIGSSCNVCLEDDPRRAAILRYAADGSNEEIFATGLRNPVSFDWQPGTGDLYATDNGRDLLGDDFPPCELNRVVAGGFYGWPFVNGDGVADPDFGASEDPRIARAISPAHEFRAHNAPLGITFVRSPAAGPTLEGAALVALHGSWNRTHKDGYKVVSLHWQPDGSILERDFLVGFLSGEEVIGRPVDVTEGPDGSFFVSDDYAGAVYRVARGLASSAAAPPAPAPAAGGKRPAIDAAAAARGAELYAQYGCAGCHEAERATPGVVPVPLAGLAVRYSRAALARFLQRPTPPMPAFPLDAGQRADLAEHLLATHP